MKHSWHDSLCPRCACPCTQHAYAHNMRSALVPAHNMHMQKKKMKVCQPQASPALNSSKYAQYLTREDDLGARLKAGQLLHLEQICAHARSQTGLEADEHPLSNEGMSQGTHVTGNVRGARLSRHSLLLIWLSAWHAAGLGSGNLRCCRSDAGLPGAWRHGTVGKSVLQNLLPHQACSLPCLRDILFLQLWSLPAPHMKAYPLGSGYRVLVEGLSVKCAVSAL